MLYECVAMLDECVDECVDLTVEHVADAVTGCAAFTGYSAVVDVLGECVVDV